MVCSSRRIFASLLCALAASRCAWGDDMVVTLSHSVALRAVPSKAYVVVYENNEVIGAQQATVSPVDASTLVTVSSRFSLPASPRHIRALFVVYGKTGEIASGEREYSDLALTAPPRLTLGELKQRLTEAKGKMRELRADGQSSGAGYSMAAQGSIEGVTFYSQLAKARLESLKNDERPRNFKRREAELSAHLNNLATELKSAREASGAADAERELREKRDLIEATKYEQFDLLRDELARLKRERLELEGAR